MMKNYSLGEYGALNQNIKHNLFILIFKLNTIFSLKMNPLQVPTLLIFLHLHTCLSFQIVSHSQSAQVGHPPPSFFFYYQKVFSIQSLEPGQTMHLVCKSDNSWEFCLWKHTNQEKQVVRDCLMEWKRAKVVMNIFEILDKYLFRLNIFQPNIWKLFIS